MYPHEDMTPAQLTDIGENLFGKRWKTALGQEIGYKYVQMLLFSQGKVTIPRAVALAVRQVRDNWLNGG